MKEKVRIKSFSKGLVLQLDDQASFDELLSETAAKFLESKTFFGKETVAITFSGRKLSPDEEFQMIDAIQFNCDLKIPCIVEKNEEQDKVFMKAIRQAEIRELMEVDLDQEIQVFRGSLRDGEELETPNNVVVFGDVQEGCSISSEKNVLVLGAIYGTARAGMPHDDGCMIAALEMAPEEISIGDFKYEPMKKINKWGKKKKEAAQAAKVQGDAIVFEELTKEHLKAF